MKIFDFIIRAVLSRCTMVLVISLALFVWGLFVTVKTDVDILPNLNRPTVTIFTEAEGMAAEEVETLVTTPLESVMNGAPGVERVRSVSTGGLALIFVEFDWKQDIYLARQIVSEKLGSVSLPEGVEPTLGPVSSIMGEIQLLGIYSEGDSVSEKELRSLADWTLRPALLTVPGVSKVTVIGGEIQEYQILLDPVRLATSRHSIGDVLEVVSELVENKSGGFLPTNEKEFSIRITVNTTDIKEIGKTVIGFHENQPIRLADVSDIVVGKQIAPRGAASINGQGGAILSITKQPGVNTLALTKEIDKTLSTLQKSLPDGVILNTNLFKQEKFIKNGINNVVEATRDAGILVVVVLMIFLGNIRALSITLFALPASFVAAILVLKALGIDINVMTLGGLAVAVGELADDAIVGVENTIRWLKENNKRDKKLSVFEIVLRASSEVRGSVIFSTLLVVLVFMPLFALGGVEGRLLAPLGVAYIVALISSTIVAMTITVVLSYWWLPKSAVVLENKETLAVKMVKKVATPIISWSIRHAKIGLILALISIVGTGLLFFQAGKEFLPPFNEGTLTIGVALPPGTSLNKSEKIAKRVEQVLIKVPEVISTARRTGRAEEDEHANGVNISEFEVDIDIEGERSKDEIIGSITNGLQGVDIEGANISIGQPISHRIEHILSGVRAPLVIKLFGSDLDILTVEANKIRDMLDDIPGTLNPVVEQEISVPQIQMSPKREIIPKYGFTMDGFTDMVEVVLAGETVGRVFEEGRVFALSMRVNASMISTIDDVRRIVVHAPNGEIVPLSQLADIQMESGRSSISHDNGQRRLVISSGILDGDSVTIIDELKRRVESRDDLPSGYFLSYEGTYKSQKESSRRLLFFTMLAFVGIIVSLYYKFRSVSLVSQILINVPVTYLGAMITVYLTGNVVNLASLVGLISILGLATRNGILLIEHWMYKAVEEGEEFDEKMIMAGSLNRLTPMLMTSLTSMLALLPLMLVAQEPGKEILYPLAVVTFGGLLTSVLVEIVIRPGMFWLFGSNPIIKAKKLKVREKGNEKF